MFCISYLKPVSVNNYIEKLRSKPQRERERIAVVATGISFAIILVIWLVSFSEMNNITTEENSDKTIDQLKSLKNEATESKKSIEEMWNQIPSQEDLNSSNQPLETGGENATGLDSGINQNVPENSAESDQGSGVPPLP